MHFAFPLFPQNRRRRFKGGGAVALRFAKKELPPPLGFFAKFAALFESVAGAAQICRTTLRYRAIDYLRRINTIGSTLSNCRKPPTSNCAI